MKTKTRFYRINPTTDYGFPLAKAGWVTAKHNVLITGPTRAGKPFLACALTHSAVRRGYTALYVRTPRLLTELALSRGDGRYVRRLAALAKIGVLVLDDFILTPPSIIEAKDLLEVIDDRSQVRSTVVVSQLRWRTGTPHWRLAIRRWQMRSWIDWSIMPTAWR